MRKRIWLRKRIWRSQTKVDATRNLLVIFSQSWPHELLWLVLLALFFWLLCSFLVYPTEAPAWPTLITYLLAGWLRKIGLWLSFVTVTFAHSTLEDDGNCCQNSAGANSVIV